ncbi:hypothetical protein LzC2_38230 [Planctomycetes bacterium LzC2]|uniref:Uncharacterized protein n=2 Tax=Alienimonas chondri TaxID=2681879 RepID=A0ABX1VI15_9PLAN|nr:hypothetical protein [Alienimonas chondri]
MPDEPSIPPRTLIWAGERSLVELIRTTTGGPQNGGGWERTGGGFGGAGYARLGAFGGVLVVRQTEAVHRQIADLLIVLRAEFVSPPPTSPSDEAQTERPTE